ncbi:hypothetical protein V8F33_009408 [Rhypophila sp. PSN 637]
MFFRVCKLVWWCDIVSSILLLLRPAPNQTANQHASFSTHHSQCLSHPRRISCTMTCLLAPCRTHKQVLRSSWPDPPTTHIHAGLHLSQVPPRDRALCKMPDKMHISKRNCCLQRNQAAKELKPGAYI